jgi:hypothetical protein
MKRVKICHEKRSEGSQKKKRRKEQSYKKVGCATQLSKIWWP